MKWVSVKDSLPQNGQAVLVRRIGNNWHMGHYLADGKWAGIWRWQAALFEACEVLGNNLVPYQWNEFGSGCLFGQEVSHWAAITDPLGEE